MKKFITELLVVLNVMVMTYNYMNGRGLMFDKNTIGIHIIGVVIVAISIWGAMLLIEKETLRSDENEEDEA